MMYKLLLLVITLFTFLSCTQNKGELSICLNAEITPIVKEYINKHPQWNTFMIQNATLCISDEYRQESGFVLGPGYPSLLKRFSNLSLFFDIDGKRLYYVGDFSTIAIRMESSAWVNNNREDSIVKVDTLLDLDGRIIKSNHETYETDPLFRFYYNGIYLYNEGREWVISERPDTLFFFKLKNTILFSGK